MEQRDSVDRSSGEAPPNSNNFPVNEQTTSFNASPQDGASVGIDAAKGPNPTPSRTADVSTVVDGVLRSDIGINTLLTRLKQSVASAREFATFLKKRSMLEEDQAQGLKKLCRSTHDSARRPDNRQGSYAQNYDEIISIHDRMADNGVQFALSLHQMHEDLQDLAAGMERGRKQWKQNGLSAEKRVQDSEALMDKAKAKYNSLAEDYDRARTGDRQSGRVFGLKGPKSAAQHEEDLQRKVQQADADYQSKVQIAKSQRQELVSAQRPQAVKALQDLINECDSGLTLQLQKFASLNERLLLGNGLCISPLKGQNEQLPRSLRDVVFQIDNEKDLNTYVASHSSKVSNTGDIEYKPHPTLAVPPQQVPATIASRSQPAPPTQTSSFSPSNAGNPLQATQIQNHVSSSGSPGSYGPSPLPQNGLSETPPTQPFSSYSGSGAPQLPPAAQPTSTSLYSAPPALPLPGALHNNNSNTSLPAALKPVFGIALEDLLKRDGSAIPLVVYQCIQAIDLYGLDVEGIYRVSGSAAHVSKLKAQFDHDSLQVDFRNPEAFYHDVNSVVGLLKQFFRDLPDPLLTSEHYQDFIDAARIDDDITRRDSMHATINSLPDPNYATLRALTLHLNRVQDHSSANRMNAGNLAIIFGPTLMGTGPNVADAGWQVRVIDTILQNTYQIFDED